jgi:arylsulfatase A-like enzyme
MQLFRWLVGRSCRIVLICLAGWLPRLAAAASLPEKPNFIFILADDMGYGDIGPFGSRKNRTPNLDRMASEGMKFTSFYAAPVCTPSRAQILTGCYAKRVSLPDVIFPRSHIGLSTNEHTIASLLKPLGYATFAIGKWHVGDDPSFLPTRHGFDHYLGLPYSNDMGGEVPGKDTDRWKTSKPPLPLVRDEEVIETLRPKDQDKLTALYTDAAIKFIRQNKNHPFFLYLPHTAVHIPLHPGEKFRGKSANGLYGDWVEEVDWCVGQVMAEVRKLGLEDRTLIVFSSDNGPWLSKGTNAGNAGPLRGGKGGTFEGGVREPTIAWWPGEVPAGAVCDEVAANFDLLPTFVKLAGGTVPTDHKVDGRDIAPLLLGEAGAHSPHEAFYYFASTSLQAVRSGPWKLAIVPQYEGKGPYTSISPDLSHPLPPRLYNLDQDIGERHDVAEEHPDIVQHLESYVREMDQDLGASKANGPGVREPGRIAHPSGLWLHGYKPPEPTPYEPSDLLHVGDEIEKDEAPQIAGKSLSITCEVKPKSQNAVIVAQGGTRDGYSLYLTDGIPTFSVRENGKLYSIAASTTPGKTYAIEAQLQTDGTMTLAIDHQIAATGKAPGLIPHQPRESMSVGFDSGAPVAKYKNNPKDPFQGKITGLKVMTMAATKEP